MKRVYVINQSYQDMGKALEYTGPSLLVLILMENSTLAAGMERDLETKQRLAQRIQEARQAKGLNCEVVVEWGPGEEVVRNCLARENAELL